MKQNKTKTFKQTWVGVVNKHRFQDLFHRYRHKSEVNLLHVNVESIAAKIAQATKNIKTINYSLDYTSIHLIVLWQLHVSSATKRATTFQEDIFSTRYPRSTVSIGVTV